LLRPYRDGNKRSRDENRGEKGSENVGHERHPLLPFFNAIVKPSIPAGGVNDSCYGTPCFDSTESPPPSGKLSASPNRSLMPL
jgi:hypothetical protein